MQNRNITLLLIAALSAASGRAQESGTPAPAVTRFVDHSLGFELDLPAAWMYDRTVFPGPGGSLGLLRGKSVGGQRTLQILAFRELAGTPFARWVEEFAARIGRNSDTQQVAVAGNDQASRAEAVLTVDVEAGRGRMLTLHYCVEFDKGLYWVLSYSSLLADQPIRERGLVRSDFEKIISSLLVLYDPAAARRQEESLRRGLELKRALRESTSASKADGRENFYEIRLNGNPVGYLVRQVQREQRSTIEADRKAKPGLRVREQSWRFGDDGSALLTNIELFSSDDQSSDLYEITHSRVPPLPRVESAAPVSPPAPEVTVDQCIREGDRLICSFRSSLDRALPDPRRPLELDEHYLGLAWVRQLPALLGTQAGAPRAFVTYDVNTRALAIHTIEPLGALPLPDGGPEAFGYRTRDGFSAEPTVLYADGSGNLLRLESGDLVLRRSDPQTLEEAFRARRQAALQRLEQSAARTGRF
jgi:hypothetical protein